MLKLGSNLVSAKGVEIGDWVRSTKRFLDGFELIPFVDYLTSADIATRDFSLSNFPDLWKYGYGWDLPTATVDFDAVDGFGSPYVSNLVMLDQLYMRVDDSLYYHSPYGDMSTMPSNLLTSSYTFNSMPKSANEHPKLLVIGVSGGENTAVLKSSETGASWTNYLTFPALLRDFDCSLGCNRIAAVSSIYENDAYTHKVFEVVKDADTSQFVINTLPTTGLDTTQQIEKIYLVADIKNNYPNDYNIRHVIVRYMQTDTSKPMFAIYRRETNSWEGFKIPYKYSASTNGTAIVGTGSSKYLYFGFEQSVWKIDPDTLSAKEIPVISRYSRPPAANGSVEYPSENLSYNGSIVPCNITVYPNVDDTSTTENRLFLQICGGNSIYLLDCQNDSVTIARDNTKIGSSFKFLVGDSNFQFSWRSDGKVETFNQLPGGSFKIDIFKTTGVADSSYRLVARKMPK